MKNKKWEMEVMQDEKSGDYFLVFPEELTSQMGWVEGTELWWEIGEDKSIFIKDAKSHDRSKKESND